MTERQRIKILLIEDNPEDAYLIRTLLRRIEDIYVDLHHANTLASAFERLDAELFDIVLSDLSLPDSEGMQTFTRLRERYPDTPLIVMTGLNDKRLALSAIQEGAQDYLVKGQFDGQLLDRAMRYSIERQRLLARLEKSLKEIKTLKGLLPMCAWCKNVRNDEGYWEKVETYIQEHTDASFTHGICPKCLKKVSPEMFEKIKKENPALFEKGGEK